MVSRSACAALACSRLNSSRSRSQDLAGSSDAGTCRRPPSRSSSAALPGRSASAPRGASASRCGSSPEGGACTCPHFDRPAAGPPPGPTGPGSRLPVEAARPLANGAGLLDEEAAWKYDLTTCEVGASPAGCVWSSMPKSRPSSTPRQSQAAKSPHSSASVGSLCCKLASGISRGGRPLPRSSFLAAPQCWLPASSGCWQTRPGSTDASSLLASDGSEAALG
mmetsp:Transcript_21635/g.67784  ORF Transcript_21635/g.67784 Transcript_21635/m.67784 type:complete len:222 (+) Transcript_21635:1428-2093(+)